MIILSNVFSYSKIGTYKNCPHSYYLTYIEKNKRNNGVYGQLGSKLHSIMEELEHNKISKSEALELWNSEVSYMELMDELNFPTENSKKNYIEDVRLYLNNFEPIDFKGREVGVEDHFKIKIKDEYLLQGYIDLYIIDHDKKEIEIVDYKTSSKSGFTKSHLLEKCYQLILYAIALENKYPDYKIIKTSFDMVKYAIHNKTGKVKERKDISPDEVLDYSRYFISVEYNEENKNKLLDYISNNIDEIEDLNKQNIDVWKPIKNKFFCDTLCSMKQYCKYTK